NPMRLVSAGGVMTTRPAPAVSWPNICTLSGHNTDLDGTAQEHHASPTQRPCVVDCAGISRSLDYGPNCAILCPMGAGPNRAWLDLQRGSILLSRTERVTSLP